MRNNDQIHSSPDRLILVGGGSFNLNDLTRYGDSGPVIAVDGGLGACVRAGITPIAVIGDMDSVHKDDIAALGSEVSIQKIDEQDSTDLEKALNFIDTPLCLGFGFLGRRFDHALAALSVLARMSSKRPMLKIVLAGRHDALTVTQRAINTAFPVGTRYSVFPLGKVTFERSDGLVWPLGGLTLLPEGQGGTSNRTSLDVQSLQPAPDNRASFALIVPVDCLQQLIEAASSSP